jgi:hypothetical protein
MGGNLDGTSEWTICCAGLAILAYNTALPVITANLPMKSTIFHEYSNIYRLRGIIY